MNLKWLHVSFILLSIALSLILFRSEINDTGDLIFILLVGFLASVAIVGTLTMLVKRVSSYLPSILLGLLLGALCSWFVSNILEIYEWYRNSPYRPVIPYYMGWLFSYLWILFISQTRDVFKVSIPYVEFKKQGKGVKPFLLDSSALIDGRIVDLAASALIESPLIVPRFVVQEIQKLADNSEKNVRSRGKRGLEQLKQLREVGDARFDESAPAQTDDVDASLVKLAALRDAVLVTTDANLVEVARFQDVRSVNLHEVALALKPVYLPGDLISVELIKPGQEEAQAVGYLEDGTMVVVDRGRDKIGKTVEATVTSNLQTSAGRMIFARTS